VRVLERHHHAVGIGIKEQDEELLLDGIDRYAAVANRTFDKGGDLVLGVIKQKLVTGTHRNAGKGGKWVAGCRLLIARQRRHLPFWFKKKLLDARELAG
jgi:hypothetical protein